MTPNFHFYANSSLPSRPSVYLALPLSLSYSTGRMAGGRGKEGDGEKTDQQRREKRAGWRGGGVVFDTTADDRLMNLWMESAGAVLLWATADNNRR